MCITYTHESSIDVILTNRKQNCMLSKAAETGLSDFYKMITTFMHNTYGRQEPIKCIIITSNFDKTKFFEDFEKSNCFPKSVKMLNDNICDNIESIANSLIIQSLFPDQAKISVTPVLRKMKEWRKRITDQSVYSLTFRKYQKK